MLLFIRRLPDEITLETTSNIPIPSCCSGCTSCSIGRPLLTDGSFFYWNQIQKRLYWMKLVSLQALLALRFRFIAYSLTSISVSLAAPSNNTTASASFCETRDQMSCLLPSLTLLLFSLLSSSFPVLSYKFSVLSSSLVLVVFCLSLEQSSCIWHSLLLLMENFDHLFSFCSTVPSSVCTETYGARYSVLICSGCVQESSSAAKFSSEDVTTGQWRREELSSRLTLLELSSSLICRLFSAISCCSCWISFSYISNGSFGDPWGSLSSDSQDSFSSSIAFSSWITSSDGHPAWARQLRVAVRGMEVRGWWRGVTKTTCERMAPRSKHLLLMHIRGGETALCGDCTRSTGCPRQNWGDFLKIGSGGIWTAGLLERTKKDCEDWLKRALPPSSMCSELLVQKLGVVAAGGWFSLGARRVCLRGETSLILVREWGEAPRELVSPEQLRE